MALIRSGMVEHVEGATALALKMETGQSARVRRLICTRDAAAACDMTIKIDRKSIFQLKAPAAWHLVANILGQTQPTIIQALEAAGLWPTIPIASGQELTLTTLEANDFAEVVYDLYEGGDVVATEPNGNEADKYRLFQVISNSDICTAAGDWPLDQSDLDAQWPSFPGGARVPANTEMHLLAMFGSPAAISKATTTFTQNTSFIKAQANRVDMFDKDLVGFQFVGDQDSATEAIDYSPDAGRLAAGVANQIPKLIVYPEPVIFRGGDELNMSVTVVEGATGGDFAAASIKLGLVFDVIAA